MCLLNHRISQTQGSGLTETKSSSAHGFYFEFKLVVILPSRLLHLKLAHSVRIAKLKNHLMRKFCVLSSLRAVDINARLFSNADPSSTIG
jgi:hypothetical protein